MTSLEPIAKGGTERSLAADASVVDPRPLLPACDFSGRWVHNMDASQWEPFYSLSKLNSLKRYAVRKGIELSVTTVKQNGSVLTQRHSVVGMTGLETTDTFGQETIKVTDDSSSQQRQDLKKASSMFGRPLKSISCTRLSQAAEDGQGIVQTVKNAITWLDTLDMFKQTEVMRWELLDDGQAIRITKTATFEGDLPQYVTDGTVTSVVVMRRKN